MKWNGSLIMEAGEDERARLVMETLDRKLTVICEQRERGWRHLSWRPQDVMGGACRRLCGERGEREERVAARSATLGATLMSERRQERHQQKEEQPFCERLREEVKIQILVANLIAFN